jgi:hypothetical protein
MIYTFWDGLYISKFHNIDKKELNNLGYNLIKKGLEEGRSIDIQIGVYKHFLDCIKDRKLKRRPIYRSDHNFGLYCIMALIKLKVIDEDEELNGLYYPPKLRRKRT